MEASKDNTLFISESLEGRLDLDNSDSNSSNGTCSVMFSAGNLTKDFELKKLSFYHDGIYKIHLFSSDANIKHFVESRKGYIFLLYGSVSMTGKVDSIVKKASGNWIVKIVIKKYVDI